MRVIDELPTSAPKPASNNRPWWKFGLVGACVGGLLLPLLLFALCAVRQDYGGVFFLPIACMFLFVVGAPIGLVVGTVVWVIVVSKQK